ncbi:MAG: RHS repeat-associated core domain-containing protein, partial [Betaproteobacteria bacterium]
SSHHAYDYRGRVLYLGTGERRRDADGLAPVVRTIAGNGANGAPVDGGNALASPMTLSFSGTLVEPDGGVLFTTINSGTRLVRLKPNGTLQVVAGPGNSGSPLFGVPATSALFAYADKIARGPDGSLYVTYRGRAVVARIRPGDQVVELFAGTLDQTGFAGDGGPATAAKLNQPRDIAVGPDGAVYINDTANQRIRRIGPDGIINTIAGNGGTCSVLPDPLCDEGPALQQKIGSSGTYNHLTVGPDGTLYATRAAGPFAPLTEFYKIGNDGMLTVIGSKRDRIPSLVYLTNEGALALDTNFVPASAFTVDADGTIYFTYTYSFSQKTEVRFIDREGRVRILAGSSTGFGGDGGPARSAKFGSLPSAIAFAPDRTLVIVDAANARLRRLESRFPGFTGAADFLIPASDGSRVYRFDQAGRHLQTLHGLTGAALETFAYDAQGRLASITDGNSNVLSVQRDASGIPTAIVSPFGQVTQLAVDANGWLTSVRNPASDMVGLVHQANGLLSTMTTPRGDSHTFAYDPATGYLLNDSDPAGGSQTLARTELAPDANRVLGRMIGRTTALGRTASFKSESMRNGDRVETAIATDGMQSVATYQPSGGTTNRSATGMTGDATESADPRWGMLAPVSSSHSTRTPAGKTLTTSVSVAATLADPANVFSVTQLTSNATVNGRAYSTTYEGPNRLITQTTPAGRTATAAIDSLGRPLVRQFGGLAPSAYTYDARGRVASVTVGAGAEARTASFSYNAQGLPQTATDPLGRVTTYAFDSAGRMTGQTLPDGRSVAMSYDASGNVTSVTPPGRPAHTFAYSKVDLEVQYNPPDVAGAAPDVSDTSYNADRQIIGVARPDGRTVTPAYDAAGRVQSIAFSRGTVSHAYSGTTGQLTGIAAPEAVAHTYTYDGTLLLSHSMTGPVAGTLAWTYDNDFRVITQSVNGANTVNYTYDADSLLTQAGTLALSRNPQNGLLAGSSLDSVTDSWSYNTHAEPTDYQVTAGGNPVYRTQLTRDALGRITQKVETINGVTDTYAYTYDAAGRLVTANKNAAPIGYTYDSNSNRTAYTGPLGNVASATYDAQDRIVQYGSTAYSYNNAGDLVTRTQGSNVTQYTYDEFGNLTRAVLPGGMQIDYIIDGMNRRVGKKINGTLVKRWLYDGALRIVAELDGGGALLSRFVYATKINVPEYVVKGGTTYRLVTDYLGSPRLLVDAASGAIAGTMNHDEYGRITQDTLSSLVPFGYAGGMYEPVLQLVRFGARDYDPEIGSWTTEDQARFAANTPNLHAYLSDPINAYDPTGFKECPCDDGKPHEIRAFGLQGSIGLIWGVSLSFGVARDYKTGEWALQGSWSFGTTFGEDAEVGVFAQNGPGRLETGLATQDTTGAGGGVVLYGNKDYIRDAETGLVSEQVSIGVGEGVNAHANSGTQGTLTFSSIRNFFGASPKPCPPKKKTTKKK